MTKVFNSDRPRLISIYEFAHDTRKEKNRAYAINKVNKAISRGQTVIELDPNKLEHKVHKGTHCYMYNRLGEYMNIQYTDVSEDSVEGFKVEITSTKYKVVKGYSRPQHGDKFSFYEGRMNALRNAYSSMKLIKSDPNFDDLLTVKRFIDAFELEVNCSTVSYQFMDLWLAVLSNNSESIAEAAINFVGLDDFNEYFANYLLDFSNTITEFEAHEGTLNSVDKYTLFKNCVKRSNPSLF